jgi:acyl-coenzyme A synthetase/AMP-(fatty) acid ligase
MGKAIPNAEVMVVNEDGAVCADGEPGELVHRGALVAMGYWGDPEKTAERFKPAPGQAGELTITELAVWSGDQVVRDAEGFLYFISRKDEMIKTSGYRVSPTEVEEVIFASGFVAEAAAIGLSHPTLGQAILVVAVAVEKSGHQEDLRDQILAHCRKELPNFMLPQNLLLRESLPRNQNGKIDRRSLSIEFENIFQEGIT